MSTKDTPDGIGRQTAGRDDAIDLSSYLARIGYTGPLRPTPNVPENTSRRPHRRSAQIVPGVLRHVDTGSVTPGINTALRTKGTITIN